jgi:hypothetical protein
MKKKKFAVFCPVKDETTFSPVWLAYYSRFLSVEDIYFLDFNSEIKPTGCRVVHTERNILDAVELFEAIKEFHKKLLEEYEYVIPTDVDEIIYHPEGLDNYIHKLDKDFVKCTGYEIIHLPNKEPEFDGSKPIFSQRNFWVRSNYYNKTLITNKPINWCIGLHENMDEIKSQTKIPLEKDLLLLHLHRFDFNICTERHIRYSKLKWSSNTVKNNYNWHYRKQSKEEIEKWYFATHNQPIIEIPQHIKDSVGI